MMNYIKSEFYRISHTSSIYLFTGVLVLLAFLLNTVLYYFGNKYATNSFSYSNFVANPMVFAIMGAVIAYFLYEGNRKNGNLKNTVSSGISRIKIFTGKCIVSVVVSTFVMILTLAVWILCAELLLEKTGPVKLNDLLLEVPIMYLIAIASLISSIVFMEVFEKNIVGILIWLFIWFIIPKMLMYLGIRFEIIYNIAMWFPYNFFGIINGSHVNMQECITVWDTTDGIIKCILSGAMGITIFALSGVVSLRRKDL